MQNANLASSKMKLLLVGGAICLAAGGAWTLSRKSQATAATSVPSVSNTKAVVDPLKDIPVPTGNTPTDKAIAKGIAQARAKPDSDKNWVSLGDTLMQRVRETSDFRYYSYAEGAFNKALALNAKNAEAMTGLAWVYGGRHEFDKSIEWANKAIALDPKNNLAYGIVGDAEVERGEYEAAFEHYQKMLDLRPDLSSYSRGAYLLHITGDNKRAQWLMIKAIRSGAPYAENTAWCRSRLALMNFNTGNMMAAEQILVDGLKTAPQNVHLLNAMGKVKAARKDYPAAISYYKKTLAVTPEHTALAALGDLYAITGNKAEAEKQYAAVEALHTELNASGQTHDHLSMAQFYADHDRNLHEALRLAEATKNSKNVFEADALAWCYYKTGDYPKAKEAIERALKWHTPDARIRYHAGMIYLKAGDRANAQKWLAQALSLNPNFSMTEGSIAAQELNKLGNLIQANNTNNDMSAAGKAQAQ